MQLIIIKSFEPIKHLLCLQGHILIYFLKTLKYYLTCPSREKKKEKEETFLKLLPINYNKSNNFNMLHVFHMPLYLWFSLFIVMVKPLFEVFVAYVKRGATSAVSAALPLCFLTDVRYERGTTLGIFNLCFKQHDKLIPSQLVFRVLIKQLLKQFLDVYLQLKLITQCLDYVIFEHSALTIWTASQSNKSVQILQINIVLFIRNERLYYRVNITDCCEINGFPYFTLLKFFIQAVCDTVINMYAHIA